MKGTSSANWVFVKLKIVIARFGNSKKLKLGSHGDVWDMRKTRGRYLKNQCRAGRVKQWGSYLERRP